MKETPFNHWNNLSLREKAAMMRVAIDNGITDLKSIKEKYNEFAEGGDITPERWTMEDEHNYQLWRASLPDNLKNTDDSEYDMRAAYKAGMQSRLESDGRYHLASRDPKTGRILKAPYHPTYLEAINTDARLGYYPTVDSRGNTYTNTWEGNQYGGGGYKPSEGIKKRISNWEGAAMYKDTIDPLSGKMVKKNIPFEEVASSFTSVLPASIRKQVLSNQELADYLFSYAYNVGPGNFKKRVVPSLVKYYAGQATVDDITNSMWASGDKKLRGLRNRRAEERQGVRNALNGNIPSIPEPYVQGFSPMPAFTPSNPEAFFAPISSYDYSGIELPEVPNEVATAYDPKEIERQERQQGLNNFATIMGMLNPQDNSTMGIVDMLTANNYFKGGGEIHIKPSHRGRLTELKARTGKTEAELYNDGNPAHKKMVVFARNARKWKHDDGGELNTDPNIFKYTNPSGEVRYVYQTTPDSEEIAVRPLNTIFPDPAQWTYVDDNGNQYTPRVGAAPRAELNSDDRNFFERAVDNYVGEAINTVPKGYHTLPAIGAAAAGLAFPAYGEAALTSAFGAHGLSKVVNGEVKNTEDALMTALELTPLGKVAGPIGKTIGNVERRGYETLMRTTPAYNPFPEATENIGLMLKGEMGGKGRLANIVNYVFTGTKRGPKGYYNSFADFVPLDNSTFMSNPTFTQKLAAFKDPRGVSYGYSGFLTDAGQVPKMTEKSDMIDALIYGKDIDPSFGLRKVAIGRDFGVHKDYINRNYFNKASDIPVYEVMTPNAIPETEVLPLNHWRGAEAGLFDAGTGYNVNAAGHQFERGISSRGTAIRQQDIWKFKKEDYLSRYFKNKLLEEGKTPPSTLRRAFYGLGLAELDRLGTPVITRTKWMPMNNAKMSLK